MVNTVIYSSYDLAPITVLELPQSALDHLQKYGLAKIKVAALASDPDSKPTSVRLYCHKLKEPNGQTVPIIVTPDEVVTLSLMPEWLPGQIQVIQHLMGVIEQQNAVLRKLQ